MGYHNVVEPVRSVPTSFFVQEGGVNPEPGLLRDLSGAQWRGSSPNRFGLTISPDRDIVNQDATRRRNFIPSLVDLNGLRT
jgi:hypothetical protein